MERLIFNRIGEVLSEKEMSCAELARKMGRDRQHISRWANNSTQPTMKGLFNIAYVLKVPPFELLAKNNPIKKLIKRKPQKKKESVK